MPVLPQGAYETLRWLLWIVIPAGLTLFAVIANVIGLSAEVQATVSLITTSIATFFGVILGVSKYNNDKE